MRGGAAAAHSVAHLRFVKHFSSRRRRRGPINSSGGPRGASGFCPFFFLLRNNYARACVAINTAAAAVSPARVRGTHYNPTTTALGGGGDISRRKKRSAGSEICVPEGTAMGNFVRNACYPHRRRPLFPPSPEMFFFWTAMASSTDLLGYKSPREATTTTRIPELDPSFSSRVSLACAEWSVRIRVWLKVEGGKKNSLALSSSSSRRRLLVCFKSSRERLCV